MPAGEIMRQKHPNDELINEIKENILKGATVHDLMRLGYPQATVHSLYMPTLRQRDRERKKQQ